MPPPTPPARDPPTSPAPAQPTAAAEAVKNRRHGGGDSAAAAAAADLEAAVRAHVDDAEGAVGEAHGCRRQPWRRAHPVAPVEGQRQRAEVRRRSAAVDAIQQRDCALLLAANDLVGIQKAVGGCVPKEGATAERTSAKFNIKDSRTIQLTLFSQCKL